MVGSYLHRSVRSGAYGGKVCTCLVAWSEDMK